MRATTALVDTMLQVAPHADPGDADMTTPPGTITAPASSVQEQLDPILQRIRDGNCKLEYAEADLLLRNSENAAVKETLGRCNNGESRLNWGRGQNKERCRAASR